MSEPEQSVAEQPAVEKRQTAFETAWETFWEQFMFEEAREPVTPWAAFWIFVLPIFFVWQLMEDGHSLRARTIGFGWLFLWACVSISFNAPGISISFN